MDSKDFLAVVAVVGCRRGGRGRDSRDSFHSFSESDKSYKIFAKSILKCLPKNVLPRTEKKLWAMSRQATETRHDVTWNFKKNRRLWL